MVEQPVPPKVIFFFFFDFSRLQYIFTLQIRIRNPFYQQNMFPLTFSPAGSPLGGSMAISASSLFSAPATDSSPEMVLSPSASLAESLSDFAFVFLGLLCFLPEIKLILLSWTSHYFPYSPPPPLPSSYPPYSSPPPPTPSPPYHVVAVVPRFYHGPCSYPSIGSQSPLPSPSSSPLAAWCSTRMLLRTISPPP